MLTLNDVSVRYGHYEALKDISMSVKAGELVVLLGANGAGKSTIFRTISGLNKPAKGSIEWKGKSIGGVPASNLVKAGIGHCPEGRKLFPEMNVSENLKMGSYVIKRNKKEVSETLERVYTLFPILEEKQKASAGSLSGGQQQMLAIGRAMMSQPEMLLLDEPSIGLAPLIVEQVFDVIQEINRGGTTILLAEQNANAALKIADRGYVIEDGNIVVEGDSQELFSNDEVRKAYIGA
ncbi:ABC transporter ATP-binding protein [Salicibibacter cibarius]|uniref:ABC transporter ATP-binding protein n=1 Tax=Salicibibacter cibarius TaxID=2743000 RepID=A0A7T7CDT3_9BACI|nr:ABC transporter ATP-binding protein [Salicibibacter cibarius]QQK78332.1 ABC transporter ATP-binding protein [Salicibibacter cibarius]